MQQDILVSAHIFLWVLNNIDTDIQHTRLNSALHITTRAFHYGIRVFCPGDRKPQHPRTFSVATQLLKCVFLPIPVRTRFYQVVKISLVILYLFHRAFQFCLHHADIFSGGVCRFQVDIESIVGLALCFQFQTFFTLLRLASHDCAAFFRVCRQHNGAFISIIRITIGDL